MTGGSEIQLAKPLQYVYADCQTQGHHTYNDCCTSKQCTSTTVSQHFVQIISTILTSLYYMQLLQHWSCTPNKPRGGASAASAVHVSYCSGTPSGQSQWECWSSWTCPTAFAPPEVSSMAHLYEVDASQVPGLHTAAAAYGLTAACDTSALPCEPALCEAA